MRESGHDYRARAGQTRGKFQAYRASVLLGVYVVVASLSAPGSILSQSEHKNQVEAILLPKTTGEPLTIKPLDMQEIDCVVAEWRPTAPKPVLTLICPPSSVFAPLRVLIKFSWMKPEDAPINPASILASAGTPTKIRTNKTNAQILLPVDENGEHKLRNTWISFNAVADVALLRGNPK